MSQRTPRWVILVASLGVPCCVAALDLDDFDDAVAALCKCDDDVPQLGGQCVEVLKNRLANVSEGSREKWLAYYAENCHGECMNAFACFQNVGTCAAVSCTEHAECCGYTAGGTTRCIEALCEQCRGEGTACTDASECCDAGATCEDGRCTLSAPPAD